MKYVDGRSFDPFWQAYRTQRKNAKKRGIDFLISFGDWSAIWLESGNWEDRGRGKGQYVMCRIGDQGPYQVGNVFIAPNAQNTREAAERRVYTDEIRARISAAQRGVPNLRARGVKRGPMSDEVKEKIRLAKIGTRNPNATKAKWTPMRTPYGEFEHGGEAARAAGVTTKTAHNRCKSPNFQDWSYI